jgi:hypothetical protein
VERQAREFELLKPYLVQRWEAEQTSGNGTDGVSTAAPAGAGTTR